MLSIEKLKNFGAKTDEGLARCINNEAMYFRLIGMEVNDKNFGLLEQALQSGDLEGAFSAAHALKGALGNLALEPLFRPASELTELLRHKEPGDYEALLQTILSKRAELAAMIEG